MLSRKYYRDIAEIISGVRHRHDDVPMGEEHKEREERTLNILVERLCSYFRWDNERFDSGKFREDCK